ncbi:MAG: hypothetical protein AW07_02325 [Candidatus Accumulibacter sp. SK-11]|nr:MAG: hypothetical protein AW07_02325 [Candidatus Accumulibacter sp. SK-11]
MQRAQVEDVILQLLQQAGGAAGFKQIDSLSDRLQLPPAARPRLVLVVLVEQADEIASLFAPGRQQRLRMHVQQFLGQLGRHSLAPLLAVVPAAQQVAVGDDVGPVVPARVVHADQDLRPARQCRQDLERLLWQARDAEDQQPERQAVRSLRRLPVPRTAHEGGMDGGASGGRRRSGCRRCRRHVGQQRTPQRRLPALLGGQWPAAATTVDQQVAAHGPGRQPVRAIHLILIKEVGKALGKLEALALLAVVLEEGVQRCVLGPTADLRQETQQAPEQSLLVEGRYLRHRLVAEQRTIGRPEKARRQRHLERRGNTQAAGRARVAGGVGGKRHLQPLRNAAALHQNGLILERRQWMTLHPGNHQIPQDLRPVAVDDDQTGFREWR